MTPAFLTALGPLGQGLMNLVDDLVTTDDERNSAYLKLASLASAENLAQIQVNAAEAQHKSIFVSGWRPYVGWVCGLALTWQYILLPIVLFTLTVAGVAIPEGAIMAIDMGIMMPLLLGLLGLTGARTYEKVMGVARSK